MSSGPSSTIREDRPRSSSAAHIGEQGLIDHLFRRYAGQVVSRLVREFGPGQLQLAEDAVQDALIKALGQWSYRGVPTHPGGWIYRVARNGAIDALRRQRRFSGAAELAVVSAVDEPTWSEERFADDQLTMMFLCCHPAISSNSAVVLTLKEVGGFGVPEIARAFFSEESAIRQRLVRAKRALRAQDAPFEFPANTQLEARLDEVLRVLYLMFAEGHNAHQGEQVVRSDVCAEAIRLTSLLMASNVGDRPRTRALLALMLLQAARLEARTDSAGELVLLEEQDRSRWNMAMIAQGLELLARSAEGDELSDYHLEAGIAACHALATSVAETDWQCIVEHYDLLLARNGSAVVALNRAIAIAHAHGPECGLRELRAAELTDQLNSYHLYHAAVGELLRRTNDHAGACASFQRALALTTNLGERRLLLRRISDCRAVASDVASEVSKVAAPTPR